MHFNIGPYDPCRCGSEAKYKFCCTAKAKAQRHGKFPVGTRAARSVMPGMWQTVPTEC